MTPRPPPAVTTPAISPSALVAPDAANAPPAPLAPVLAVTALNTMGAGIVTSGIFFLTRHGYGFSDLANYALGCLVGAGYIAGSLGVAPLSAWLQRRFEAVSARGVLATVLIALALTCLLPITFAGPTSVWILVALYSPLIGAVWPSVQGYVVGGRPANERRKVLGTFSLTWGSALVLAYWAIAPWCERAPAAILAALGGLHLLSLIPLAMLPRDPSRRPARATHEAPPPGYRELLRVFRWLLPLSSLLLNALSPYLPGAFDRLGVPIVWHTALVTCWLVPRAITFGWLGRSHRWQGRWSTPVWTLALMAGGFALCILAPVMARGGLGLAIAIAGLLAFGIGMGFVYVAAIYYAQNVGRADVSAGARHEALIGVGFLIGPAIGALACGAVELEWIASGHREPAILATVFVVTALVCGVALRQVRAQRTAALPRG